MPYGQTAAPTSSVSFNSDSTKAAYSLSMAVDRDESPLSRELGAMVNGLAELEQAFSALSDSLAPVSLGTPDAPSNSAAAPRPSASTVVESLINSNERISQLVRRVHRLRSELQV